MPSASELERQYTEIKETFCLTDADFDGLVKQGWEWRYRPPYEDYIWEFTTDGKVVWDTLRHPKIFSNAVAAVRRGIVNSLTNPLADAVQLARGTSIVIESKADLEKHFASGGIIPPLRSAPPEWFAKAMEPVITGDDGMIRKFATGATRDTGTDKLDYEAFMSPELIEMFAKFMHYNRFQTDGKMRDGDNWQKGIPKEVCLKSEWRHFHHVWMIERGFKRPVGPIWHQLAVIFNAYAWIKDYVRNQGIGVFDDELAEAERLRSIGQKP